MNCEVHSDLVCVLFCQNCQQPVYTKCLHVLENKHKEHRLSSISDVYDEKFCEMEDFRYRVGQNIPFCSQIQHELEHMLDSGTKQYGEQRQILIQKEDDVITEFQSNIMVLLKEVDSEWKTLEGTLKEEIKVMKILKDHMEKEREIACQVSYKPSKTSHDDMKGIFGDFLWQIAGQTCKLKKSYQTHLKGIQKVLLLDNNEALIWSENNEDVIKVQFDNTIDIKVLKAIPNTRAYDMGKIQNGDIIISVQESQLKMYREKDTIENFHSFYPLKTFGIHVNKYNEILVGISTGLPDKEEEIPKPGKIVVLNCKGSVKRTYENIKNKHSKECCVCPTRIVTNQDNIIYFINIFRKNKQGTHDGIIVSIDHNGKRMWTYGEDKFQFCPEDIAIMNSAGCICVLTNAYTDILSKDGIYIARLQTKIKDSLESNTKISTLAFDKNMNLYAGEKTIQKDKRQSAQIHIFEIM
ncbi:TRIM66 [Mytilus coruscus]|uniref:TRIM66 n=1 Tax=Mytilus coruscus TaxID=42192 RepID=A0A6J8EFK6_MYTCO|nr:TRIM66 [Mytilus coruscus]